MEKSRFESSTSDSLESSTPKSSYKTSLKTRKIIEENGDVSWKLCGVVEEDLKHLFSVATLDPNYVPLFTHG